MSDLGLEDDFHALLGQINANWTTQAIGAGVRLGVADALSAGPSSLGNLARRLACSPPHLVRLLRAWTSLGLCVLTADEVQLTTRGRLLTQDAVPGLGAWALWCALGQWDLWTGLSDCIRTGQSVRASRQGLRAYEHFSSDDEGAAIFHAAMNGLSALVAGALCRQMRLEPGETLIDLGGGHGGLLIPLLREYPGVRGIIVDLEHARAGAESAVAAAGMQTRCAFIAGDFMQGPLPAGRNVLLKSILHNWEDEDCLRILAGVRSSLQPAGRCLVVERLLPDTTRGDQTEQSVLRSDLNMLVSFGSRERTLTEFHRLLAEAGMQPGRCAALPMGYALIEAQA